MGDIFASLDPEQMRARELERRFKEFDRKHPEVFVQFRRFAMEVRRTGKRRFSADAIMHRVRWECIMLGPKMEHFKINNDHVAFYARKLMEEHPEFRGFFETRMRRHENGGEE